jgi:serine/threonine-protein kinase
VTLKEGDVIHSRYHLLRLIGRGASGEVWAARNQLIDRNVALKVLEPEVTRDKVLLRRFFNEAKSIGRVKHPSIVEILDLGQAEDGSPFLVLELLDGEPLRMRLAREGNIEPELLFDVSSGIARGLDLAHQQGIIHRDLKPANIFLHRTATGSLVGKILDFGISKIITGTPSNFTLTRTGTVVGSPAYMSPEQAAGREDLDGRADVWSLGIVLYEALCGMLPHQAPNYNALMVSILTEDVMPIALRRSDLPPSVCHVIDSCLKRDRDRRPGANALASMLEAGTRELRAERFRQTGGRRKDDQDAVGASAALTKKIALAALVAGVTGGALGFFLGFFVAG